VRVRLFKCSFVLLFKCSNASCSRFNASRSRFKFSATEPVEVCVQCSMLRWFKCSLVLFFKCSIILLFNLLKFKVQKFACNFPTHHFQIFTSPNSQIHFSHKNISKIRGAKITIPMMDASMEAISTAPAATSLTFPISESKPG